MSRADLDAAVAAAKYPLGSTDRLPHFVVFALKQADFFYGGDYVHRIVPMHVEWTTRLI